MTFFVLPTVSNLLDINLLEIQEGNQYVYISATLQKYLADVKKKIDKHPIEWDIYKKFTNPYEYIQTPMPNENQSVSSVKPLSRSYFKMIELLKIHNILNNYKHYSFQPFICKKDPVIYRGIGAQEK